MQPFYSAKLLSTENAALVLIDHQPRVTLPVRSIDPQMMINNAICLAKVGAALGVPTVISTILAKASSGALFPEIQAAYPNVVPIDRAHRNAFTSPAFVDALKSCGRKKLIMAGVWTEVCLTFTVLSALEAGYEAYIVVDASGGTSIEAHEASIQRMSMAGAVPVSVQQVMSELIDGVGTPENRAAITEIVKQHSGALGQLTYYAEEMTAAVPR
jgi:nicotinamidase-related amidase